MKAFQLSAPGQLRPVPAPVPDAGQLAGDDVLVRILAASVCGSDIPHFVHGARADSIASAGRDAPPPGFPLHEIVGEVVASADPDLAPGDRVVGWASGDDGLAELVVTGGAHLARCTPDTPPWQVIVAQPLACVLYAIDRLPAVRGTHVAVLGLGPIGLIFSHVLDSRGATRVTGVDPVDRSDVSGRFGVTEPVIATSTQWLQTLDPADRPGVVIEAVGHQVATLRDALGAVATSGTVYCFGIPQVDDYPVSVSTLVRENLTVIGGITYERRRYLERACHYLAEHPELARAVVTHVLPWSSAQRAFELASVPRSGRLKVVLTPDPG
ncbi:alcohol dehydrogenase [Actinobacteria bacterium YIM 96077]|uniref:Alcohol dehydrogenase n=1 Tax=Phytoactinopolyspora halophila TaxID=1981511 RepID=A0A329QKR7_9ACTN|nr:zinc-binding dehydrogenase [Phytoactinopolyspora halophila]AYY12616.1 alcohol dehydrogenase [Actinobacteria bacterium YIM 96077]RAW12481.1 alcohol dehydrogenase [Phytoactinopolyspora halophila]